MTPEPDIRQAYVQTALESYRSLARLVHDLTLEELYAAITLEYDTRRRGMVVKRLMQHITNRETGLIRTELQRKYPL